MVSTFTVFCAPAYKQEKENTKRQHTILEHKAVCIMLLGSKDLIIGITCLLSIHFNYDNNNFFQSFNKFTIYIVFYLFL